MVNEACESGPQIVTRRGLPVAVLVSYEDYSKMDPARPTAVDILLGGPKIEGGLRVERDRCMARHGHLQAIRGDSVRCGGQ